jgi:hypothetical protein
MEQKLWQPMGAEADATWITGPDGIERGARAHSGSFQRTPAHHAGAGLLFQIKQLRALTRTGE